MGLGHEQGFGAPCLKCKDKCEGFELHFWRKICRNCKCGQEEHDVLTSNEEDRKVGKLFEDTKYTTLIAKLKTDGIPMYKRNVMILTNPVSAKKNISINTVTYEWAPPVQNQTLARQYMQMLPKEKQPVAGSEGAQYRKKQLAKQLPAHDQDPSKCHELSPNESCYRCKLNMKEGDPAVYAERAGYDKLWHPACFVCCTCNELLVDMIYFWKNGNLYCGRHYCDSEKPRCAGCDELIFSNEYTQAEGQNWHLKHFCCFDCDCVLAGEIYVMVNDKPVCKPCYVKNHAVVCQGCHNAIDPEVQRVTYNNFNWHATTECFLCSCCSKSLIGQKFMPIEGMVFCSVEWLAFKPDRAGVGNYPTTQLIRQICIGTTGEHQESSVHRLKKTSSGNNQRTPGGQTGIHPTASRIGEPKNKITSGSTEPSGMCHLLIDSATA
ncbi:Testin [Chelonia mydas]|uniref:Testin n=1 Tax=Chelonia mydas TaxID=8469 RepID=M7ARV4_CHEMY|nr:Testin [Chelonia mydas]